MASKCTMVLDTDVGTDDAVALLMALSQPSVDLIGVTCVHGNTCLDNVLVNTLRVLKLCKRLDVSVLSIFLLGVFSAYTLLTLKCEVNLLNAPLSSIFVRNFDSDWQHVNTFSLDCVTLVFYFCKSSLQEYRFLLL